MTVENSNKIGADGELLVPWEQPLPKVLGLVANKLDNLLDFYEKNNGFQARMSLQTRMTVLLIMVSAPPFFTYRFGCFIKNHIEDGVKHKK